MTIAPKSWIVWSTALATTLAAMVTLKPPTSALPTVIDVQQIAEANGFYTRVCAECELDKGAKRCRKIIISKSSMSEDDVALLCLGRLEHPSWRGCVCVMREFFPGGSHVLPLPDDIVGDLLFFGDLDIIRSVKASLAAGVERN
jgi:hypothetical protein